MSTYFAPGCDVKIYRKSSVDRLLPFLMDHENCSSQIPICCKQEQKLGENPTIITACPGCQNRFGEKMPSAKIISLWEVLDKNDSFPIPSHKGKKLAIHDPCLMDKRPEVHNAVRSLAEKMEITLVEPENTREHTECCGDDEDLEQLQRRADQMPIEKVLVYCMGCYESMNKGGKKAIFLLDLLMGE